MADGYCPGGEAKPHRIRRQTILIHSRRTDVFEIQLAEKTTKEAGLGLAAALREALTILLGVDAREIAPAAAMTPGPQGERRTSVFLYDTAAGGAGYVTRLTDPEALARLAVEAIEHLHCPHDCQSGCPACVLRPDLNFVDLSLDRRGALDLARRFAAALSLPEAMRVFGHETRQLPRPAAEWLRWLAGQGHLRRLAVILPDNPECWQFDSWENVQQLLPQLARHSIDVTTVCPARLLKPICVLDPAARLALAALSRDTKLATISDQPRQQDRAIVVVFEGPGGITGVACDPKEASPGPTWASGATVPAVYGPMGKWPNFADYDPAELIRQRPNAGTIWPGRRLDGPAAGFGERFWSLIESDMPAAYGAILRNGVTQAAYSDRYLNTPTGLALLASTLRTLPKAHGARLKVDIGRRDPGGRPTTGVNDDIQSDATRRDVLQALLPSGTITVLPRSDMPHYRSLTLRLSGGGQVIVLLDQGLGAWRSKTFVAHDFSAASTKQADRLAQPGWDVAIHRAEASPISISLVE